MINPVSTSRVLLQLVPMLPALLRLPWLPLIAPLPLMLPVVEVRLTVLADTGPATLIAAALRLKVPLLALAALVIVEQAGQFCKVTVPLAVSVTFTLPFSACRVRALALTVAAVPLLPTEPLSLTSTTTAADPVAPAMPLPLVVMLPLPAVADVASR